MGASVERFCHCPCRLTCAKEGSMATVDTQRKNVIEKAVRDQCEARDINVVSSVNDSTKKSGDALEGAHGLPEGMMMLCVSYWRTGTYKRARIKIRSWKRFRANKLHIST